MHVIVWRYDVASDCAAAFRTAYGADGDWARLFKRADGFIKVELFESPEGGFVTLDYWASEAAFAAFKTAYGADYAALDKALSRLSRGQQKL